MKAPLTKEETARALGVSEATLDRMIERGEFPDAIPISPNRRGWPREDVKAFLYLRGRIGRLPGAPRPAPNPAPEPPETDT